MRWELNRISYRFDRFDVERAWFDICCSYRQELILAPLTRGSTVPYRRLCEFFGAKVTASEMIFARQMLKDSPREKARLRLTPEVVLYSYGYPNEFYMSFRCMSIKLKSHMLSEWKIALNRLVHCRTFFSPSIFVLPHIGLTRKLND